MAASKWGIAWLAVGALLLSACGDSGTSGPTTQEFAAERDALKARIAKSQGAKKRAATRTAAPAKPGPKTDFAQLERGYTYDSLGKRDPFRNFKWERPDRLQLNNDQGPLEQFDLSQLSLVAVVWKTGNARALIQDPSGESYIIGEGAHIGKNSGFVTIIRDGLVVVKETYVDYLGHETTKDIEMRMRRNEGG